VIINDLIQLITQGHHEDFKNSLKRVLRELLGKMAATFDVIGRSLCTADG
jgi:hypothetical protein